MHKIQLPDKRFHTARKARRVLLHALPLICGIEIFFSFAEHVATTMKFVNQIKTLEK